MSKRPPKQQGYPWLIPYLVVKDADAAIAFYQKAFGFETKMVLPMKDGKTGHVEMVWKDTMIMFGPVCESSEWPHKPPVMSKVSSPISLYVYCDDVDALFARAVAAGAKAIQPLRDQFYGDRNCVLEDPDGYWWNFATNVADFDPSKAPG
jgi:PhnB protein